MAEQPPSSCAICGYPIKKKSTAVLLSDPARELEHIREHYDTTYGPPEFTTGVDIDETPAISIGGPYFLYEFGSRRLTVCSSESAVPGPGNYQIPVHHYCLKLAKKVFATGHGILRSVHQLYKVLRMRCIATVAEGRSEPLLEICAPNNYQLPLAGVGIKSADKDIYQLQRQNWERVYDHWCGAAAWDITDLTSYTLAALRGTDPSCEQTKSEFRIRFENLPQELQDHVLSFLISEHEFPLHCTRLAPQAVWMKILLDGKAVPFLWDIDRETLKWKALEAQNMGREWDFELLVRRLCYNESEREEAYVSGMPPGLRNRRRIWRLLEEMYVGDYLLAASCDGVLMAIPRYWDKLGHVQYPLVWMRRGLANNVELT